MNPTDRFLAAALLVFATLCVAGIVHIVAILAIPRLVEADPFARLSALTEPGRMQLLPRPAPGAPLPPFSDPAVARAVCLFDLSKTALRLAGTIDADRLLMLSFRTRDGHVFFALTDRAAVRRELNILVLSPSQLEEIETSAGTDEDAPQELRLVAPAVQGIVLVDAPSPLPGEWPGAEERVMRLRCEAEAIAVE